MKYYYTYNTTIGDLCIIEEDGKISAFAVNADIKDIEKTETALINQAYNELLEYLDGKRKSLDIPVLLKGTDFQKTVWRELMNIPYGETRTYKQIAENIGNPQGYRAVGNACNKNNLLIIVPCHRVVGSDKSLTGFAIGLDVKKKLINIEAELCMKN